MMKPAGIISLLAFLAHALRLLLKVQRDCTPGIIPFDTYNKRLVHAFMQFNDCVDLFNQHSSLPFL